MRIGDRIKKRRLELGLTQEELAEQVGYKSKSSINKIEIDGRGIPQSKIEKLAKALHTTPAYLMGWEDEDFPSNVIPVKKGTRKIPVLGSIAAGQPIEAIEDIVDYVYIPEAWQDDFIALKIDGNSMSPTIPNGSTVIIRLQDEAESGDIVAVYINGYDATCKKLKKLEAGGIVLISLNPDYEPMAYTTREVLELPIRILGKVVEVRTKV